MRKKTIVSYCIMILTVCSCSINDNNKINIIKLISNNDEKYWDLIYLTDIYGKQYNVFDKDGFPENCIKFEYSGFKYSGKVTHYRYIDHYKITDRGCGTDISFNPDRFILESDSIINFGGRKHSIKLISKDFMILRFGDNENNNATLIYSVSKKQNKYLVMCK